MADLTLKFGAMDCGKSTAILQAAHNYEARGMKILVLKPKKDTKGDTKVVSRLGISRESEHLVEANENLYEWIENNKTDIRCIFVDEAQFLSRPNVNDLLLVAVLEDIPVICYGLRTDFQTNSFPGAARLMEVATKIETLGTICNCGKEAQFNTRLINGEFVFEGDQVAIDGEAEVSYISLCPKCYLDAKEVYYNKQGYAYQKKRDLLK